MRNARLRFRKLNLSHGKVLMRSSRSRSNCLNNSSWAADSGVGIRDAITRWKRWILLSPLHEIFEQCQKSSKAHSSPDVIATNNKYTDLILIFQSNGVFVDHFCNVRTHFQTWFGIEKHRKPGNHFLKSKKISLTLFKWFTKLLLEWKICSKIKSKLWCV